MAKVKFKRIEDSSNINTVTVEDGSFIITGDGKSYIDYGTNRVPTNGTLDTTMSGSSSNAVENSVIKSYVDSSVGEAKGTILWSNQNPYNSFTAQTINLSSDDYDMLEILTTSWIQSGFRKMVSVKVPKGLSAIATTFFVNNGYYVFGSRVIDYNTDTSLNIRACDAVGSGNMTALTTNNDVLVPYCVIGYKTDLF